MWLQIVWNWKARCSSTISYCTCFPLEQGIAKLRWWNGVTCESFKKVWMYCPDGQPWRRKIRNYVLAERFISLFAEVGAHFIVVVCFKSFTSFGRVRGLEEDKGSVLQHTDITKFFGNLCTWIRGQLTEYSLKFLQFSFTVSFICPLKFFKPYK